MKQYAQVLKSFMQKGKTRRKPEKKLRGGKKRKKGN